MSTAYYFNKGLEIAERKGGLDFIGGLAPIVYKTSGALSAGALVAGGIAASPVVSAIGTAATVATAAPIIYYGVKEAADFIGKIF